MACRPPRNLFHRAIVESGSMLRAGSQENSRRLAEFIISELDLNDSSSNGRIYIVIMYPNLVIKG
jgi:carboxylesterase type B